MALTRVTWFFEQLGYGWTETLWIDAPNLDSPDLTAKVYRYTTKRIKCSGKETFLKYARWSLEGVFRDARIIGYSGGGQQGQTTKASDEPNTALLVRMRSALGGSSRNHFLRGIWDEVVWEGGTYNPGAEFLGRYDDWRAQILNDGWGWYGVTSRLSGDITSVTQNPTGSVTVVVDANIFAGPFPRNTTVRVAGALGATQINGTLIVRATNATTFTTRRRISIFPWTVEGRVTHTTKGLITIGNVFAMRIVNRKVGRPSFKSPGRRPARAGS